jgi:hypothetical protein
VGPAVRRVLWTDAHRGDFLLIPPGGVDAFRDEFLLRHDTYWL